MAIDDKTITRLRTAATVGDPKAAYELARLLCMTASDPADASADFEVQTWPEEPWLRAVLSTRPLDVPAMTLLAGRLIQQIDHWQNMLDLNPDAAEEYGEDETTIRRRQAEAEELFTRIRAADPENHVTGSGLAELAELAELIGLPCESREIVAEHHHEAAYSFYVLDDTAYSGSVAHCATIVATRPDELRWACDQWISVVEGCGMGGEPTLTTYTHGEETSVINLADYFDQAIEWDAFTLPPLGGEELPAGLPVPGRGLHYGFAGRVD
ncbi:tetratricopeptide repeat protein [Streptomyces sp. NPDC002851]